MTTTEPGHTEQDRPRSLQDELLDDLRQAAPMPGPQPAQRRSAKPKPRDPAEQTPSGVELSLRPQRWSGLRMRPLPNRTGLVVSAGPVRLSLTLPGR